MSAISARWGDRGQIDYTAGSNKVGIEFCAGCNATTRHAKVNGSYCCLRCGAGKFIAHNGKPSMTTPPVVPPTTSTESFEIRLSKALGLIKEESDKPKLFEPDADKKKTAKGAHRSDNGVEYYQMKSDKNIKHKEKEKSIR